MPRYQLCFSLVLAAAFMLSGGCQRLIDIEVQQDPYLGATCFLSPAMEHIEVNVFVSQPLNVEGGLAAEDFVVSEVGVTLHRLDSPAVLTLSFNPDSGWHRIDAPPGFLVSGGSYRLDVIHERLPALTAECTIPMPPEDLSLSLDSASLGGRSLFSLNSQWSNTGSDNAYYRLIGRVKRVNFPDRPFFFFGWRGPSRYADYQVVGGNTLSFEGPIGDLQSFSDFTGFPSDRSRGDSAFVRLLRVSESYYRFQLSLLEAEGADPLLSQPVSLYSSFENGQGVLAAFAEVRQKLRVR